MHLLIEVDSDGNASAKDGASGEPLGLVEKLSTRVSRTGNLERLEVEINESPTAKKKAAKAEKAAAGSEAEGGAPA